MDAKPVDFIDIISEVKLQKICGEIANCHRAHLRDKGVRFTPPSFVRRNKTDISMRTLQLVALALHPGQLVSIGAIHGFVVGMCAVLGLKTRDHVSTQQVRHLSSQDGWNVLNRMEFIPGTTQRVKSGFHMLVNLTEPKLGYSPDKRDARPSAQKLSFPDLKDKTGHVCQTCGSKEGEPHRWSGVVVQLTQGHMDPSEALIRNE